MSRNDGSNNKSQWSADQWSVSAENCPPGPKLPETLNHQYIDGINYLSSKDTIDLSKVFPLLQKLNFRENDVFLAGFPKSGNHWIFEILNMILQQNTTFTETVIHYNFLETRGEDVERKLDEIPSPRVLGTHLRPRRFPKQILEKRVKIICPIRNPKDVAVSMYNMMSSMFLEGLVYKATFSEFFNQFFRGEFVWGDWFDHVLAMEEFMNNNPSHPVFIVSYEKMKENPTKVIRDLCAFLEKPGILAKEIAKATEMSNMKKVLLDGKEGRFLKNFMKPDGMFRKGIVGDWKQWLTVSQSEAVDKLFQEKMSGSTMACLVKDYI